MHYVLSDIHGCYKQYMEMLNKINFSQDDVLYVNGDVFDRGENPIAILEHMIEQPNIIPIMGNHEVMAMPILESITYGIEAGLKETAMWAANHNEPSLEGFNRLQQKNKEIILEYVKSFAPYVTITVNDTEYLITHAGFDYEDFDENRPLDDYDWEELVWAETDYEKAYYHDKILITGHTPTGLIDWLHAGKIIRRNNHIAIDCGCVYGGNLGCICLETGEEFYVKGADRDMPRGWAGPFMM